MKGLINSEVEIKAIIENWARAVRNQDIANILAYHADNIVMFDVPEPFQSIGIDSYRKTWDLYFKYAKPGVFEIEELDVVADTNVAFCIAIMMCEDCSGSVGFERLRFRLTVGLKKIANEWMIVHEHHSIPSQ